MHKMLQISKTIIIGSLAIGLGFSPIMASAATVKPAGRKLPVVKVLGKKIVAPKAKAPVAKKGVVNTKLPGSPVIFGANPVINIPPLASPTAPLKTMPTGRVYAKAISNDQPIILTGDEVLEITNTRFTQKHNIVLKDRAKLIIKDSQFELLNGTNTTRSVEVKDYSQIKVINSDLRVAPGITFKVTDHGSVSYSGSSMAADATSGIPWHEVDKDASVMVYGAPFHGSIKDRAKITIDRSADVFLDMDLNGAIIDEAFPRTMTEYAFPGHNDRNVYFKLAITNSVAYRWGIKTYPTSNITVRDTDGINIGMVFGWPLENATIELDGLQTGKFEDRAITARQMKLRLINTTVSEWIPVVGDSNTLRIKNASLTAQQWDWGWANITLENCVIPSARTKQNVTMTLKDCTVNGDITATDDSKIILINTTVAGNQKTRGNGKINEQ
jgi:hypothetical protein